MQKFLSTALVGGGSLIRPNMTNNARPWYVDAIVSEEFAYSLPLPVPATAHHCCCLPCFASAKHHHRCLMHVQEICLLDQKLGY